MELRQVGKNTYYLKNPTNIGIYKVDNNKVYLIDSGNNKEAGKKIIKIIEENGWEIKGIINTHSNADHIGGNKVIQERCGADVLAYNMEACLIKYPILEPTILYGGYPFKEIRNKFLLAQESIVKDIQSNLPLGLEYFPLKGHFLDMIGIKTSDDVYFLGDSLFSLETISKYHIFFIYDVRGYLDTLDFLETLKGKLFIPSHGEALEDLKSLIDINRKKILEIIDTILKICLDGKTFEDILKEIGNIYKLEININQYVLVGSTIKSYLAYLYDEEKLGIRLDNNKMYWFLKK